MYYTRLLSLVTAALSSFRQVWPVSFPIPLMDLLSSLTAGF